MNFSNLLPVAAALSLMFLSLSPFARSQSFIGVNYGQVADNLPAPEATVNLLKSTTITKVRLYGADPAILRALAGTSISVVIGAANGDIPSIAADPTAAYNWVSANVLPFVPATGISVIAIGNEVLNSGDPGLVSQLLPALKNLAAALSSAGLSGIKVTTVNTMAVLGQSDPPSTGAFHGDLLGGMQGILGFLQSTGSPFMINPYPYFAYRDDPRPETLAFCLFQQNAGRFDAGSKITYTNMFDAQLDAVKSAVTAAGFPDVEIVVAETGWPYKADAGEPGAAGATVENAKAFNGGLIAHLRSLVGTPLMPGRSVDTYIFALYDEDLKPGPTSERSFGLFRPDLTPTYDAGLSATSATSGNPSAAQNTTTSVSPGGWCVPTKEATDPQLQSNLDFVCQQPKMDCRSIQAGGLCYEPNTVRSHAAYAMNQWFQVSGRHAYDCDFKQTGLVTTYDPSYDQCIYPAGN